MLRVQQLETYFNSLLPQSGEDEKLDIAAITKNCSMLAALITGMIDEDFAILTTGIFKKASSTFKAIHDLYLDKYADEMSALIEEIYDDLKDIIHRNSAQSSSEFLFDANHKKPLLKGYSSTAEQGLLSAGGRRGSHSRKASIVISRHYLQSLRDILLSVFHIDEHIDYLYKMATTSGSSTISNKRRGSKGSLRGNTVFRFLRWMVRKFATITFTLQALIFCGLSRKYKATYIHSQVFFFFWVRQDRD